MHEQAPTSGALVWDQVMVAPEEIDRLGFSPEEVGLIIVNGIQSELDDPVPPNSRG